MLGRVIVLVMLAETFSQAVINGAAGGVAYAGSSLQVMPVGMSIDSGKQKHLISAQFQIVNNFNRADVLAFFDTSQIKGEWDRRTGTLLLRGKATPVEYAAALRSVQYSSTAKKPSGPTRAIHCSVDDGIVSGAGVFRSIHFEDGKRCRSKCATAELPL